jgi:hypothetical protein
VLTCVFSGGERAFVFPPEGGFGGGVAAGRMWERGRDAPGRGGAAGRMWERDRGAPGGGGAAERMWERDRVAPGGGGLAEILFPIAAAVLMGILQNNER